MVGIGSVGKCVGGSLVGGLARIGDYIGGRAVAIPGECGLGVADAVGRNVERTWAGRVEKVHLVDADECAGIVVPGKAGLVNGYATDSVEGVEFHGVGLPACPHGYLGYDVEIRYHPPGGDFMSAGVNDRLGRIDHAHHQSGRSEERGGDVEYAVGESDTAVICSGRGGGTEIDVAIHDHVDGDSAAMAVELSFHGVEQVAVVACVGRNGAVSPMVCHVAAFLPPPCLRAVLKVAVVWHMSGTLSGGKRQRRIGPSRSVACHRHTVDGADAANIDIVFSGRHQSAQQQRVNRDRGKETARVGVEALTAVGYLPLVGNAIRMP